MTPQEFRDAYLEAQDTLGNRLQRLESFAGEFSRLMMALRADYEHLNHVVDEFLAQQPERESSQCSNSD